MELSTAAAVERLATVSSNRRRSESIGEHASGAYGCKTFTRLMRENCNEEDYCSEQKAELEQHISGVLGMLVIPKRLINDKIEIAGRKTPKGFQFLH